MRRLFVRIYAALFGVLGTCGLLLAVLAPRADRLDVDRQVEGLLGRHPSVVRAEFAAGETARGLQERWGMAVAVLPADAVASSLASFGGRLLAEGRPLVLSQTGGPAVYVPLDGARVAVLRPPTLRPLLSGGRGVVLLGVLLVGLGAGIYFAVRPLEAQLLAVAHAAERIGGGELAARAGVRGEGAVAKLAGRFDAMADRVERMVEGRRGLLHGVSHELRTPLARIRFGLELLDEDDHTRRAGRIEELERDLGELDALVGELLRYAELEGGAALHLEPLDLAALLEGFAEEARRVRPGIDVEFVSTGPAVQSLDRRHVARSLSNLVTNAARYATARVGLTLSVGDGDLVVCVDDDGPGVPLADRERIFEPFVRLDGARSRDQGGIGLGLALARRAVEAHGGTLTVSDSPMGGARFRWALPGGSTTGPIATPKTERPADPRRGR